MDYLVINEKREVLVKDVKEVLHLSKGDSIILESGTYKVLTKIISMVSETVLIVVYKDE